MRNTAKYFATFGTFLDLHISIHSLQRALLTGATSRNHVYSQLLIISVTSSASDGYSAARKLQKATRVCISNVIHSLSIYIFYLSMAGFRLRLDSAYC
jgi:hypothetical protein